MPRRLGTGRPSRGAVHVLVVALLASLLAACSTSPDVARSGETAKGGTLRLLYDATLSRWDPQRIYGGPEAAIAVRTFLRTLTGYPAGGGALVGDLATDTGRVSDSGKTWTFTVRPGATWEDGAPVTCADVAYGISRNFARDVLPGGAPYAVTLLDIPDATDPTGLSASAYAGPYAKTGQDLFDKAVSCAGSDLTIRLKVAETDFPQVAALPIFAPYRADHDTGKDGAYSVFSCGPYRLDGTWATGSGGRFVRNTAWSPETDPLRQANPDVIDIREDIPVATVLQRVADSKEPDNAAISLADAPAAVQTDLLANADVRSRVSNPASGSVELLLPNFRSAVMAQEPVRRAFAMATNRTAFAAAYGSTVMTPTYAALAADVPGHQDLDPFGAPPSGDPTGAKAVLTAAGVALPVPVRVAYRASATADSAFAALKATWEQAGFTVELTGIADSYYATIASPDAAGRFDVFRTAWSADYPSGSAVLPPMFDGRAVITLTGAGQDYGYFSDGAVSDAIDAAYRVFDQASRDAAWGAVDLQVAKAGGHIALAERHRVFVRGSAVRGYTENPSLGGWVDLAGVSLQP
jgi:peptide/nickel transport system substrate-binding protein